MRPPTYTPMNAMLAGARMRMIGVATRLGTGVEYANLDGYTGLNVAPGDPAALADAVNALLSDPSRRHEMGAFARKRVEQEFRAEDVARRAFELYRETVAMRTAPRRSDATP